MEKAVLLFSGGQDSTTLLGWAKNRYNTFAIIFDYGQKHLIEISQAKKICNHQGIPFKMITIHQIMLEISDSPLVIGGDISGKSEVNPSLPASFVQNRNLIFLTFAHSYAQRIGAKVLIGGMCETDYSGYPDCRLGFILDAEKILNYGSGLSKKKRIKILTPLMKKTKAETFKMAKEEGILSVVIEDSHTCYNGDHSTLHLWGYGCGECPACKLRAKGYYQYKTQFK